MEIEKQTHKEGGGGKYLQRIYSKQNIKQKQDKNQNNMYLSKYCSSVLFSFNCELTQRSLVFV